ncbi:TPA: class I SAM-dependent methyltransferase [Enterococcus faecium]|nr:class I SAM-dependent methyltransferase [Enterococcus faecium]
MSDNKSAFNSNEYDRKIKQTLPYYNEFYEQVIELVKVFHNSAITWLDIGCGTGKMGSIALENIELEKLVFCDSSDEMIRIAKERFQRFNTEFSVCDIQNLEYTDEFDVITAIQVNHYFKMEERKIALQKCYKALKENGLFISFENFSPFTDVGKIVYLEKWKRYQIEQGKSFGESTKHIERYGKDYFPITLEEHLTLMRNSGFRAVEILWLSNIQVGFWGIK